MVDRVQLISLYKTHKKTTSVAKIVGVSRERVRQLLNKVDDPEVMLMLKRKHVATSDLTHCQICKRAFSKRVIYSPQGICQTCKAYQVNRRNSPQTRQRQIFVPSACVNCHRSFAQVQHRGLGHCAGCYTSKILIHSPAWKAAQRRYHERNKERLNAEARRYYARNRDHLVELARQYRIKQSLGEV